MMSILFTLLAKRAFSGVLEGMSSKSFLLALLACSKPSLFGVNNTLTILLITFIVSYTFRGG